MSSGWAKRTLAQLANYHNGRAFKPSDWAEQGLPIIRIAQISNPEAAPNYYDGHDVDDKHLIGNGDILFSWSATLAVLKWKNGPAILNQHIFKVVENEEVCRDFLRYLLQHSLPALAERSHGSTMKHIRKGVLREHIVSVPPLPEQRMIAAILSSVDNAIEKTQAVIDQVQIVKRGLMQELLTRGLPGRHTRFKQTELGEIPEEWQVLAIGDLGKDSRATVRTGPFGSSMKTRDFRPSGVPVITIQSLGEGELNSTGLFFISKEKADELSKYSVEEGDLVFSRVADIGRSLAVDKHLSGFLISPNLMRIRPDWRKADARFVMYAITMAKDVLRQINSISGNSGRPVVSSSILRRLRIPVPHLSEQREIASVGQQMESRIRTEMSSLSVLKEFKSTLLSVLLTGELRVTPDTEAT